MNSLLGILEKPLIISILAGVTLNRLEMGFPDCPVIRTMPSTPVHGGTRGYSDRIWSLMRNRNIWP
ncbi:MAG UNVERIFIED_CONTAM: hypothetical protein LVR29_30680 [Microcystis novacekii LVE1205-3]